MASPVAAGPTRIKVDFDPDLATIWLTLPILPVPCITPTLIEDFNGIANSLRQEHARQTPSEHQPFKFLVVRSVSDRVFNLGGDLKGIAETIKNNNRDQLDSLAVGGAEASFNMASGFGCCFVTISLVRGRAFGGGFETARCCHLMTAERNAQFHLPEAALGLFPGHGIGTVIAPKIGDQLTRRLMLESPKFDAETALKLGVIDELYEAGRGDEGVRALVARLLPSHFARISFEESFLRRHNITMDALCAETSFWARTISGLSAASLERISRVGMVQRRMGGVESASDPMRAKTDGGPPS